MIPTKIVLRMILPLPPFCSEVINSADKKTSNIEDKCMPQIFITRIELWNT